MTKSVILVLVTILMVVGGCKSKKVHSGLDLSSEVVNSYWKNQYDYEYLEARGKATVQINGSNQNVSMHLKMKKDSVLWGRFSLFGMGVTVLIDQDSFFLMNNLSKEYMKFDNSYLNDFLGFKAELGQIQNLLVGNAVFDSSMYTLDNRDVSFKANEGIATNTLVINELFRTLTSNIGTIDTTQYANIKYDQYGGETEPLLPKVVNIHLRKGDVVQDPVLNYQVVSTSRIASFPFKIPNGFVRK
ncbi:MAG TPA: hypothetical protein DCY51_02445 [Bacteroidetes bacterium]|nr:hypothetical protein [Bacteroidota bacterium]